MPSRPDDVSLAICGQAGQGIKTVESLLLSLFKGGGNHVFSSREYMSRIRGGMNTTSIRVSSRPVRAYSERVDVALVLHRGGAAHLGERLTARSLVVGEADDLPEKESGRGIFLAVPWREMAREIGAEHYVNSIAAGVLAGVLRAERSSAGEAVEAYFAGKGAEVAAGNRTAFDRGYAIGERFRAERGEDVPSLPGTGRPGELLLAGTEAVALGAMAGGCDFLSFYPMSPSTGVGVFIAGHADGFGIEVEQAEDEISAVNMSLGAWFAGARALVTTSGGGFALMAEGLSLAGAIESPAVIHLAQRPGPATGLPTRTEQGDLLFALFAGHGEFPRILLAPGSLEEAFSLSREAFNLADRFQVPVVVLTDQYLLDSHYDLAPFDLEGFSVEKALVESSPEYRRYAFTDTGISPRGVPGFGDGLVCADSDEHDQSGHITESMVVRTAMVDKRLKKAAAIEKAVPAPEFFGDEDYRLLVLGWGSTREALIESLEGLKGEGVGYLHFSWIHPLWPDLGDWMKRARRTVAVENNATGQFARLIRMTTGQEVAGSVRKYDGLPFSVEELSAAVKRELSR